MTVTTPKPRTRQAPSKRDQEIYLAWQTGRKQIDLAKDYGVGQTRISQIIGRVRAWRNENPLPPPEGDESRRESVGKGVTPALTTDSPEALQSRLHREQLEYITRQSLRAWRQENKTVAEKTGTRGDKPLDETTTRTAPPNLQCLRVALQAIRAVGNALRGVPPTQVQSPKPKVQTRDEDAATGTLDLGPGTLDSFAARQQQLVDLLTDVLNEAVVQKKIRSTGVCSDEREFAEDLVAFLVGQPHRGFGVAVVSADGQHGRLRAGAKAYPGRDPLRVSDSLTQDAAASTEPDRDGQAAESSTEYSVRSTQEEPLDDVPQSAIQNPKSKIQNCPATTTTSSPAESPQPPAAAQVPIQNSKSKVQNDPDLEAYISAGISEAVARRLRHQEKLQQLRELQRKGLPYMIMFDAADGPLPPAL